MTVAIIFRDFAAEIISTKTYKQNVLVGRLNIVKMSVLPNVIYSQCDPDQNPSQLSLWFWQTDSKVYKRGKRPGITHTVLKKNKVEGLPLPYEGLSWTRRENWDSRHHNSRLKQGAWLKVTVKLLIPESGSVCKGLKLEKMPSPSCHIPP